MSYINVCVRIKSQQAGYIEKDKKVQYSTNISLVTDTHAKGNHSYPFGMSNFGVGLRLETIIFCALPARAEQYAG